MVDNGGSVQFFGLLLEFINVQTMLFFHFIANLVISHLSLYDFSFEIGDFQLVLIL